MHPRLFESQDSESQSVRCILTSAAVVQVLRSRRRSRPTGRRGYFRRSGLSPLRLAFGRLGRLLDRKYMIARFQTERHTSPFRCAVGHIRSSHSLQSRAIAEGREGEPFPLSVVHRRRPTYSSARQACRRSPGRQDTEQPRPRTNHARNSSNGDRPYRRDSEGNRRPEHKVYRNEHECSRGNG